MSDSASIPTPSSAATLRAPVPVATLEPGDRVDRYRIGRRIGEGGYGVVYEAEHVGLGYPVALKVLDRYAMLDPSRRARFRREAVLGARLRHRNIVAIVDSGELGDGTPWLAMEHVGGRELAEVLDESTLDPAATLDVGVQLLAALSALSASGVLHRDIKPNNVMLARAVDGAVEVKLLDFGISKALRSEACAPTLTREGFVLGTPQYMSPEQVRGGALDVRSDLYAIGALLYECLAGAPPIDGERAESVLARILVEDPTPLAERAPGCPAELAAVIDRALAKKPEDRYADPRAMSQALRAAADRAGIARGADAWAGVLSLEASAPVVSRPALALTPAGELTPAAEPTTTPRAEASRSLETLDPPRARFVDPRALWPVVAVVMLGAGAFAALGGSSSPPPALAQPKRARAEETPPVAELALELPERTPSLDAPAPENAPTSIATPSAASLEQRALAAMVRGRPERAVTLYRRATQIQPERASAWRGLGLAAASSGQHDSARAALGRYLRLAPSAPDRREVRRRLAQLSAQPVD